MHMYYLRQHNVINAESSSRGYVDRFLAVGSEVERDPALPLSLVEDGIHDLERHHLAVHLQSQLPTDLTRMNSINLQNNMFEENFSERCSAAISVPLGIYFLISFCRRRQARGSSWSFPSSILEGSSFLPQRILSLQESQLPTSFDGTWMRANLNQRRWKKTVLGGQIYPYWRDSSLTMPKRQHFLWFVYKRETKCSKDMEMFLIIGCRHPLTRKANKRIILS